MKRKMVCRTLALLLAVTVCAGAALACGRPEAARAGDGIDLLYCGGHHGGGHHGGGRHGCHGGSQSTDAGTVSGTECPWLFCPSKGCVDVNCTNADHYHYCPALCADPEHEHYCDLEGVEFACGETWHRSGCCHQGTVVYSKGCTDDYHNCTVKGHYHHCPVDCANPAHEHFTIARNADGSVEMVMRKA